MNHIIYLLRLFVLKRPRFQLHKYGMPKYVRHKTINGSSTNTKSKSNPAPAL